MTKEEYELTFGQWCNKTKGMNLQLTEFGGIDWREPKKDEAMLQYHELWMAERQAYILKEKNENITNAMQSLKKEGIECVLCNYQNGHIKAKTKHGIILSYYATTETIAGYKDTDIKGLDEFIRLCRK